jgi:tetratricopeptide (TPR) repeat protein
MSRFSNLEFREHSDDSQLDASSVGKDEAFFLRDAQSAFEEGNFERGLRSYAKVLEYNPQNASAWSGQVRMLIELAEYSEAKLWADKALERFPRDPQLLAAKAVALARCGDLKSALAFSDAAFEERGDTPYIWLARADVLHARKETRGDFCLQKAISLAPGNWFVSWLASRILFHYQRFGAAVKVIREALAIDATRAVLWLQLGFCQRQVGLAGPANQSFGHALDLNPHLREANRAINEIGGYSLFDRFLVWLRHPFFR